MTMKEWPRLQFPIASKNITALAYSGTTVITKSRMVLSMERGERAKERQKKKTRRSISDLGANVRKNGVVWTAGSFSVGNGQWWQRNELKRRGLRVEGEDEEDEQLGMPYLVLCLSRDWVCSL